MIELKNYFQSIGKFLYYIEKVLKMRTLGKPSRWNFDSRCEEEGGGGGGGGGEKKGEGEEKQHCNH